MSQLTSGFHKQLIEAVSSYFDIPIEDVEEFIQENGGLQDPDKEKDNTELGKLLKAYRLHYQRQQKDLQYELEKLGYPINASTISKYEAGARNPPVSFIVAFTYALGMEAEDEQNLLNVYMKEFEVSTLEEFVKAKGQFRSNMR